MSAAPGDPLQCPASLPAANEAVRPQDLRSACDELGPGKPQPLSSRCLRLLEETRPADREQWASGQGCTADYGLGTPTEVQERLGTTDGTRRQGGGHTWPAAVTITCRGHSW